MVNLFFVISGYVLSYRPLSLLYSSNFQKMYEIIASSVFRRAFRLWLPTMAAALLIAILTQMRFFQPGMHVYHFLNTPHHDFYEGLTTAAGLLEKETSANRTMFQSLHLVREKPPILLNSTLDQAFIFSKDLFLLITTSAKGEVGKTDVLAYDAHFWTIPVEFKSSMAIFTLMMGTSMFESHWRLLLHTIVFLYCASRGYSTACFVGGMIIAEMDIIQKHNDHTSKSKDREGILGKDPSMHDDSPSTQRFDESQFAWGLCLIFGLYFLSIPYVEPVRAWPYAILANLVPDFVHDKNKLIRLFGAILTTWSCVHSRIAEPMLNSGVAQYLGKISFALYLTHGSMIKSLGYVIIGRLRASFGALTRETTTLNQFMFIWVCGYLVMLPLLLWIADVFSRSIDVPSVKFARWLEHRFKSPREENP